MDEFGFIKNKTQNENDAQLEPDLKISKEDIS